MPTPATTARILVGRRARAGRVTTRSGASRKLTSETLTQPTNRRNPPLDSLA
jgi:hypothetical protein